MIAQTMGRIAVALMASVILFVLLFPGIGVMAAEEMKNAPDFRSSGALPATNAGTQRHSLSQLSEESAQLIDGSRLALSKVDAATLVQESIVNPLWAVANKDIGLKVLQYNVILPKGTKIEPAYEAAGQAPASIVSQNPSWLFMIDEMPGAHFAHPVKLVVVDAVTKEQKIMETEWWPKVNDRQVFEKEAVRADPSLIVFYKKPTKMQATVSDARMINPDLLAAAMQCESWAVIVCGFNDLPDTFDEDTNGVYSVLKGQGLDDDHIYYLSPHSHAGVDRVNTVDNVQWAINEVAAQSGTNDKVLFFYSSHGGVDFLVCDTGTSAGGIWATDLDSWLDAITCKEMAVIVEACHSGSLIGKYKNGNYVPTESDLTVDGESNRVIFTSASTDTSSYADVDGPDDPNPSDSGSESIYGYIMAFSEPSADKNGDGKISFGEAYQYAWENDVTRLRGDNVPQMLEAGLNKANVYHKCFDSQASNKFKKPLYEVRERVPIPKVGIEVNPKTEAVSRV